MVNLVKNEQKMSSREIAELTGKEHKNICRDIRVMFEQVEGKGAELKFELWYFDVNGRRRLEYSLPKDLTITLVSGYRADLRLKIVRRWMELEDSKPKELTYEEIVAKALAITQQRIEALECKIEEDKPKVTYATAVSGAENPVNLRSWINSLKSDRGLQKGERAVIRYLIDYGYLYREKSGNLRAYANCSHWLTLVPVVVSTDSKGSNEYFQLKVTGEGQVALGNKILKHFQPESLAPDEPVVGIAHSESGAPLQAQNETPFN